MKNIFIIKNCKYTYIYNSFICYFIILLYFIIYCRRYIFHIFSQLIK